MIGLESINKVTVPVSVVEKTIKNLRYAGRRGVEGIVLWVGIAVGSLFEVKDMIYPIQSGLETPEGLLVVVEANELHRINKWLFDHKMVAIAQLHSHPGEAYHSITDDTFPIVTTLGGLSIVVPDFASKQFQLNTCAVYRLSPSGWIKLEKKRVESLIGAVE